MCKRFTPLSRDEAQDILDAFTEGKPIRLPDKDINDAKYDVFPGKTSPVFLSDSKGGLVLVEATWGFLLPTARNLFSIRGSILLCVIWYRARGCGARLSSKADVWSQLVHFMRIAKQTSVTANGQIRNGRINGRWTSRNR